MVAVRTLFAVLGALIAGTLAHVWLHPSSPFLTAFALMVFVVGLAASTTAARRRNRQHQFD